jgi:nucleotide-binding universal stress UspA family protein
MMFHHVLVPLDGSSLAESALPHTAAVARAFGARVTLVHVLERLSALHARQTVDPLDWQLKKTEADLYLSRIYSELQHHDLEVEQVLLEGNTAERILEYVHSSDIDLIVLSSHGQSGPSSWNVSSVTQKVLLKTPTSTLVVRATQESADDQTEAHYRRLMVPLDGSRRAEYPLSIATTLAQSFNAELVLAHVVTRPEMPRRTPLTHEDTELCNRIVERNREEASQYLDSLTSHLPGDIFTRLMVSDSVATCLHDLVEQEHIDLVVLSAHGYSGTPRWLYGSVASRFITDGTVPLLIVQPGSASRCIGAAADRYGNPPPRSLSLW